MRNLYSYSESVGVENRVAEEAAAYEPEGLPNRLLNAREVAKVVGRHEETVRRAYWRGLLRSQRFGVQGRRFHPEDVLDWICAWAANSDLVNTKEQEHVKEDVWQSEDDAGARVDKRSGRNPALASIARSSARSIFTGHDLHHEGA